MFIFETLLVLLVSATGLSALARRFGVPYPAFLALGGACVALLPSQGIPTFDLAPQFILTLFVAPVLLDAAHDTSLRELKEYWRSILSLVLVAVGLTTVAVAFVARWLFPDMPWAVAIALGALLAPPDAVAAITVLRQVKPPHRLRKILEGESLLNDASALLIYKLAVGAFAVGHFSLLESLPTFGLVLVGSVVAGWGLAWLASFQIRFVRDTPTSIILQFVITFGVWLLAEHLGLSGVIVIVVFGLASARYSTVFMPARLRVSTFAIWESATFVLNVLAFTLIGLQLGPLLGALDIIDETNYFKAAGIILFIVIIVRLAWVSFYAFSRKLLRSNHSPESAPTVKGALVVGWSGMRGIVTLAASLALPNGFPYRDFIQLTAFVVVLGTLVIQGITLRPLLLFLRIPKDRTVQSEVGLAREAALNAALRDMESDNSPAAQRLKLEYKEALTRAHRGQDAHKTSDNALRLRVVIKSRDAIHELRRRGVIGDDAYRLVEEELDWFELSALPPEN